MSRTSMDPGRHRRRPRGRRTDARRLLVRRHGSLRRRRQGHHHLLELHLQRLGNEEKPRHHREGVREGEPRCEGRRHDPPYADYFTALQTDLAGGTVVGCLRHRVRELRGLPGQRRARSSGGRRHRPVPGIPRRRLRQRTARSTPCRARSRTSCCSTTPTCSTPPASSIRPPTGPGQTSRPPAEKLTMPEPASGATTSRSATTSTTRPWLRPGGDFLNEDGSAAAFNSPEGLAGRRVAGRQERHHECRRPSRVQAPPTSTVDCSPRASSPCGTRESGCSAASPTPASRGTSRVEAG